MGICVVENGIITEQKEILIKPEPFEFNEFNIHIHGITPAMVRNCNTFDCCWSSIKPYLEGKTIAAHNASFDVNALRAVLDMFGIPYPSFQYICTVKLSQKAYPELDSHKLNRLCDALGISFKHHHAMDDSYACASVLLRIMEDYGLDSLSDIEDRFEIGIGRLFPGFHEPCKKNKKPARRTQRRSAKKQ